MYSLIAVGKLKEKPLRALCDEYLKRLQRYRRTVEIEVPDLPERDGEAAQRAVMDAEAAGILSHIPDKAYVIALAIGGERLDSMGFAEKLDGLEMAGKSHIVFVIGGSLGLGTQVMKRSDARISLSDMTLPHGLARLVLLEQVYRARKILAGERYHK